jgi:hypothetical protein
MNDTPQTTVTQASTAPNRHTKTLFWRGVFSEPDGTPSFSRVATGLLVSFACGWVTAIVWKNHALPDFAGLALFIGTLYGSNKLATAWSNRSGSPQPPAS